jgi:hypothetical protein
MKYLSWILLILAAAFLVTSRDAFAQEKLPLPVLDDSLRAELTGYLQTHRQTPEEYVINKFKDHDVVILGEQHRARQDPLLVQRLIPLVYKAGVYNLGFEFARRVDQPLIDSLLTGKEYDQVLANEILLRFSMGWCYQEYSDIFKAAWQLNRTLKKGEHPFRIIGVNNAPDWSVIKSREDLDNRAMLAKAYGKETEKDWADALLRETVAKREKALVYCGIHHAFTSYRQPMVENGKFSGFRNEGRFGNFLRDSLGQSVMTIFLHNFWLTPDLEGFIYPVEGYIDALMAIVDSTKWRVGFDTKGTPLGRLPGKDSYYAMGYDSFNLATFCDGYIFQMPFSRFEVVSCIPNFYTDLNIDYARNNFANPVFRSKGIKDFEEACEDDRRGNLNFWAKLW